MYTRSIKIKYPSINSMIAFANASTRSKCRVMVKAGRISMDGKSIMNLFMLDITKKVKVKITGDRKDVELLIEEYRLYGFICEKDDDEVYAYA